jgi:glycosyltransferase involved in cell wall biosynthesis
MRVAWVSIYNALDPRAYQGRGYYAPRSLARDSVSVEYIGPLETPFHLRAARKAVSLAHRVRHENRFINPQNRRWFSGENLPFLFRDYARQISSRLSRLSDVDVVCSGVSPCSQPVSYLECRQPIVIWTDTTFASAIDFYPQYFTDRICQQSIRHILTNEEAALRRCHLAIFASEWGARNAIERYGLEPRKVRVVPLGANCECENDLDDVRTMVAARSTDTCKLLFIGVDWFRKGGDIAIQVAKELNRAGVPTELTVVGCEPLLNEPAPVFLRSLGYISNATPEGAAQLSQLFEDAHFFIMPSRAESFGHVFCEASAFGVPSVATNIGGIPTAIRDGMNGRTFLKDASIEDYSSYIAETFRNRDTYERLAMSSFNEYQTRLNWQVAGATVTDLLAETVRAFDTSRAVEPFQSFPSHAPAR